ncbi:MAG: hypothetical protein J3Q66DRAFT_332445, partial [Benniella sp.]
MTTTRIKDLHSDDLKFMGHFPARLEIEDIPQHTEEDQLALIFQLNIPHLHLRFGCGKEYPRVDRRIFRPEDDMKFQDVVGMATSICKIKSLRIDYRKLSIQIGASQGATQNVYMAITTLGIVSLQDVDFIKQCHLTRLTTWYDQGQADEIWWIEIIRTSQSLTHLRVGCKGEHALSLVELVLFTRKDTLQRRGSCSLRTFESMEDPQVPFDVLADRDSAFHIQSHIAFPDNSITFDMRTWIRFEKMTRLRADHPMLGFILRYGQFIVFLDGYIFSDEKFADLLDDTGSRRLESLIVYSTAAGYLSRQVDRLLEIIKRSPNLKLGLCLQLGNDVEEVQAFLCRHGAIISKIQLRGGTPEQWSRTSSSFLSRHHFPVLESFEALPTNIKTRNRSWKSLKLSDVSYFRFPWDIVQLFPKLDESDANAPRVCRPASLAAPWTSMKKIALRRIELQPKEWTIVLEGIDFKVIEHLNLQSSNFSQEQFKQLLKRLPPDNDSDSNVPLRTLNIVSTPLTTETDLATWEEWMAELRKKATSVTILKYANDLQYGDEYDCEQEDLSPFYHSDSSSDGSELIEWGGWD